MNNRFYSYNWAKETFNTFWRKYARATKELAELMHINYDFIIRMMIQPKDKRVFRVWYLYKCVVKEATEEKKHCKNCTESLLWDLTTQFNGLYTKRVSLSGGFGLMAESTQQLTFKFPGEN